MNLPRWKPNPIRYECNPTRCRMKTRWQPDSVGEAFDRLHGCWPITRRSSLTDVDGEMNIDDCLLFVESKCGEEKLPWAQKRMLECKANLYGHSVLIQRTTGPHQTAVAEIELLFRTHGDVGVNECSHSAFYGQPCIGRFEQRVFTGDAVLRDALILAWSKWVEYGRNGQHPWIFGSNVWEWLDEHYPSYRQQQVLA